MRTYTYHPLILLVIILSTVSCENELPFNIKDNPPKLVMNAFINADSLTNVLFLNLTGVQTCALPISDKSERPCVLSLRKQIMTSNAVST